MSASLVSGQFLAEAEMLSVLQLSTIAGLTTAAIQTKENGDLRKHV